VLKEKRSTVAFLDVQREIIIRELEVMVEHVERAKLSGQPIDFNETKFNVSRDFAAALQKLKDELTEQLEELMRKRSELTDEIETLIQTKDRGFQEYESLVSRNVQLLQHNNALISAIQGSMRSSRQ
jgi:hypothetical protein